ncbi:protein mono-ADP-ribosyltransferase PARP14-like [Clavelina lepadiformis]|uniref:protein mono-ADP-ribosyltransferase PARP14-like n=1 Tax=Clavelina lepadiformis TaxID=159417 RepID=UPI00404212E5
MEKFCRVNIRSNQSLLLPPLTVHLKQGNILSSDCDVIVNTTGKDFNLTEGQLSKKLLQAAGNEILSDCQSNPYFQSSACRITKGGNLKCKNIAHVVTPVNENGLFEILQEVFEVVDGTLTLNTLALPAIGTGEAGLKCESVAETMRVAIETFAVSQPQNLKRVDVVVFQPAMLNSFKAAFSEKKLSQDTSAAPVVSPRSLPPRSLPSSTCSGSLQEVGPFRPIPQPSPFFCNRVTQELTAFENFGRLFGPQPEQYPGRLVSNQQHSGALLPSGCAVRKENHRKICQMRLRGCKTNKRLQNQRVLQNELLTYLDDDELMEITNLGKTQSVNMKRVQNLHGSRIIISGSQDNVNKAFEEASEILRRLKSVLVCAQNVRWTYHDPIENVTKDFSTKHNFQIEEAYSKKEVDTVLSADSNCFYIDLINMKERSIDNGKVYDIKRCPRSLIKIQNQGADIEYNQQLLQHRLVFPETCSSDIGQVLWKKVNLDRNTKEYSDVCDFFAATINKPIQFKLIERIQNYTLYTQFVAQKEKVETRMKSRRKQGPATKLLFHGTSADTTEKICKDGFDRSFAGKNGTAYGKGVYFATTAKLSCGFAKPDPKHERKMFLAEVITGEFCKGGQQLFTPPTISGSKDDRYDSVVDNEENSKMFVVFKDASAYPLYLITFK